MTQEQGSSLSGKVAIITGASSGIGQAVALGLAGRGASVIAVGRDQERLQESVRRIRDAGGESIAVQADVADAVAVEGMVGSALDRYGRVDFLANIAGVFPQSLVVDMAVAEWEEVIRTNLTGTFLCCRAVLPSMIQRKSGSIVNCAAVIGRDGGERSAHYGASKAGIVGFTKCLAFEVQRYGVRVNALGPGRNNTPMLRRGRTEEEIRRLLEQGIIGEPEEVVDAFAFFASDASRLMTGQVVYLRRP